MKILILGGTGAMGKPLVDLLSKNKENTLYVTSRSEYQNTDNILYIKMNAHDLLSIKSLISKDIYDCIVDFMDYGYDEFKERYNLFLDNTKQYIFFSSSRVYDDKDDYILESDKRLLDSSTDSKFLKTNEYSLRKAKEENLLFQSKKKNYTIVRPYISFNDHRLQLGAYELEEWFFRAVNGLEIVLQKELVNKKTTLTYGNDVAIYISKLIGNNEAIGEVFTVSEDKMNITWNDVINVYKKVLNDHNINLKIKLINGICYDREYQLKYDRFFNRSFDCSKISKISGYSISGLFEEKIKKCIDSYMKNPKYENYNIKLQAYMDKKLHNISSLKYIKGRNNKIKYIVFRFCPIIFLKRNF